ncbi:MAG TPA: hypothetical protein VFF72_04065, partial [Caldimonas sp.]|nr:hypothetical protein [Caldimonas sp.]
MVDLLVAAAPDGVRYEGKASEDYVLAVAPLSPHGGVLHEAPTTSTGPQRPLFKALVQSGRSDFHQPGWEAPPTLAAARAARGRARPVGPLAQVPGQESVAAETARAEAAPGDRGLAATDYLLGKYLENGATTESFESTRIELERSSHRVRERVDVYEMYWADLSRLSGAIPRIVTELFTLVFRLSKLGRETVDEARLQLGARAPRWRWLAGTQMALDWAFVNGLAALFAQLGLLGVAIV